MDYARLAAGSRCATPTGSGLSVGTAVKSATIIPAAAAWTDAPIIIENSM